MRRKLETIRFARRNHFGWWWLFKYHLLFWSVLCFVGLVFPHYRVQPLNTPIAVTSITPDALLLADGRRIQLRNVSCIPWENEVFKKAVADGVEIDAKGDAIGRLWGFPKCGNDMTWGVYTRIRLGDLAVGIDPDSISTEITARFDNPNLMRTLRESSRAIRDKGEKGVSIFTLQLYGSHLDRLDEGQSRRGSPSN